MTDEHFRVGERLWLRGKPVTFVGYHRYAPHPVDAAVVRRPDEKTTRVVPLRKLTRNREESFERARALLVS
jgi:hypothetical protein